MLPLSHIYVSTKVAKKKTPLLVFGSVLPDISWTSDSEIARDQIHYAPKEFYNYVSVHKPQMLDLALGVKLHSNIDKGADYYSDDATKGFAYLEGKKINSKVANILGVEPNEKSLVLSHNFVEAGVELNILDTNPELLKLYKKSMDALNLDEVSLLLSEYLNKAAGVIILELKKFVGFFGPGAYSSDDSVAERIALLIKGRLHIEVDKAHVYEIIEEAQEMTRGAHLKYLDNAIAHMSRDFENYLV